MKNKNSNTTPSANTEAYVSKMIDEALQRRCSDVHIQPHEKETRVLFRVDGLLCPYGVFPSVDHERIISRLKVLASLPVYQRDLPQEGRLETVIEQVSVQARLAVFPTIHGEKAVVRFLQNSAEKLPQLDELGLSPQVVTRLRALTERNTGCILLTGPSGSGKTTTIYSLLRDIYCRRGDAVNIVTIEDPVEVALDFAVQSEIRPALGYTFPVGLRSVLRQDPEVLMLGEVRDRDTAEMVIEAGLTGHLVISTIHSGSAVEVFTRLLEMGLEPFLVASSILGVLSQRLLRKVCAVCKGAVEGCEACANTGYRGRSAVGELLVVDEEFRRAVLGRTTTTDLAERGGLCRVGELEADALERVQQGATRWEEVMRVLPKGANHG